MSLIFTVAAYAEVRTLGSVIRPLTRGLAPRPSRRLWGERGHLGPVSQSTNPAERPVYGRLETYRRTEPRGGNDEHKGWNTAGS
jgi:hypothetical protein